MCMVTWSGDGICDGRWGQGAIIRLRLTWSDAVGVQTVIEPHMNAREVEQSTSPKSQSYSPHPHPHPTAPRSSSGAPWPVRPPFPQPCRVPGPTSSTYRSVPWRPGRPHSRHHPCRPQDLKMWSRASGAQEGHRHSARDRAPARGPYAESFGAGRGSDARWMLLLVAAQRTTRK